MCGNYQHARPWFHHQGFFCYAEQQKKVVFKKSLIERVGGTALGTDWSPRALPPKAVGLQAVLLRMQTLPTPLSPRGP